MINKHKLFATYFSNCDYEIYGDVVTWKDTNVPEPTDEELENLSNQYLVEAQNNQYKDLRKAEYPSLEDMIVALIEKEEGRPEALNALMELRLQVKLQYPKPEGRRS